MLLSELVLFVRKMFGSGVVWLGRVVVYLVGCGNWV